jgi:hypothetical protein
MSIGQISRLYQPQCWVQGLTGLGKTINLWDRWNVGKIKNRWATISLSRRAALEVYSSPPSPQFTPTHKLFILTSIMHAFWLIFVCWKRHNGYYGLTALILYLRAGRSEDRISVQARFFAPGQTGFQSHTAACTMDIGPITEVKRPGAWRWIPNPV